MALMFRKRAFLILSCLGLPGFLAANPGSSNAFGTELSLTSAGAEAVTARIELFVLAFVDSETGKDETGKLVKKQAGAREQRGGLTVFQEKTLIVVIAIVIAFVIAWKLAGRSQEDIQRLLNRSKKSADSEKSSQTTDTELSTEMIEDVKPDTVPEIPVVTGEDTDPELPITGNH
ncbi:MAG TPA: hypothetical protein VMM56_10875 [Planctomycetaceae bacterium]|nr:hypothetical protein [Planctomycetaceae bacterium]